MRPGSVASPGSSAVVLAFLLIAAPAARAQFPGYGIGLRLPGLRLWWLRLSGIRHGIWHGVRLWISGLWPGISGLRLWCGGYGMGYGIGGPGYGYAAGFPAVLPYGGPMAFAPYANPMFGLGLTPLGTQSYFTESSPSAAPSSRPIGGRGPGNCCGTGDDRWHVTQSSRGGHRNETAAFILSASCVGIALALGLLGLAPGSVRAQYFDGAWAYSDLGRDTAASREPGFPATRPLASTSGLRVSPTGA